MIAYLSERMTKVWLLHIKNTRGDRGRLSLNPLREVCVFLHPINLLVRVTPIANSSTSDRGLEAVIPLNPIIQANLRSIWVILESGSVFVCGGGGWGNVWSKAYINGWAEQAKMHKARYSHGERVCTVSTCMQSLFDTSTECWLTATTLCMSLGL